MVNSVWEANCKAASVKHRTNIEAWYLKKVKTSKLGDTWVQVDCSRVLCKNQIRQVLKIMLDSLWSHVITSHNHTYTHKTKKHTQYTVLTPMTESVKYTHTGRPRGHCYYMVTHLFLWGFVWKCWNIHAWANELQCLIQWEIVAFLRNSVFTQSVFLFKAMEDSNI